MLCNIASICKNVHFEHKVSESKHCILMNCRPYISTNSTACAPSIPPYELSHINIAKLLKYRENVDIEAVTQRRLGSWRAPIGPPLPHPAHIPTARLTTIINIDDILHSLSCRLSGPRSNVKLLIVVVCLSTYLSLSETIGRNGWLLELLCKCAKVPYKLPSLRNV